MSIADKLTTIAENEQKVYEKGVYDRDLKIWEMITNNGTRKEWERAFAYSNFTDYEFVKPVFVNNEATRAFYSYAGNNLPKNIDLSGVTGADRTFAWSKKVEEIYDMNMPALTNYNLTYSPCNELKRIEIVRTTENTVFTNTFSGLPKLEDITFDGTIGTNISFADCPLNIKSIKNILLHLKDYSGTTNAGTYILTLKDTCKTAMANLGTITELNNKTYTEYLASIGWNLA